MARTDPKRLTPAVLERIADLHARGYGRNAIARELNLAAGSVTKACSDLGLSFDREATKVAVAARRTEAAAIRSELELQLLEDAQRLRGQMWQRTKYVQYGGKDFERREWTQAEPSAQDKKNLMAAAGMAVDRSIRLAEMDKGSEIDAARSMLAQLLAQLGVVFGEYDADLVAK